MAKEMTCGGGREGWWRGRTGAGQRRNTDSAQLIQKSWMLGRTTRALKKVTQENQIRDINKANLSPRNKKKHTYFQWKRNIWLYKWMCTWCDVSNIGFTPKTWINIIVSEWFFTNCLCGPHYSCHLLSRGMSVTNNLAINVNISPKQRKW